MTNKLFSELGLSPEVLKAIDRLGFEQASPIQAESIPILLAGSDVVGQSMTGSGKTAAFAVPAIEKVDPTSRAVQILILCPTRELAVQVSEEIHKLTFFKKGIHALPVYGGQSYERQFFGLKQGAQIVIGTPGRVMDHMRRGTLRLESVKMAILDEADVMLDMGFREDIEFILQAVPAERQTVFFSATMPRPIQDLIQKYARNPKTVRIEQKSMTVPTVEQCFYEVDRRFKIELLTRLIDIHDLKLGIVFCNTKRMVDDLVDHLNAQGYSADRLHGDMSQAMRDRVMNKFRKSGLEFLVATDVAARGIDVDDVQVVFNFDLPYDAQDYVHRIGRTGRAGRSGLAVSFVSGREIFLIQQIERFTRMKIRRAKIPTPAEVETARQTAIIDKLRKTLQAGEFKRQDHLIERLLEEGFNSTDIASALLHHLQLGEGGSTPKPVAREEGFQAEGLDSRDPRDLRDPQRRGSRGNDSYDTRPARPTSRTSTPPWNRPDSDRPPVQRVVPVAPRKPLVSATRPTLVPAKPPTTETPAPTTTPAPASTPKSSEASPKPADVNPSPSSAPQAPAPKPNVEASSPAVPSEPREKPERPAPAEEFYDPSMAAERAPQSLKPKVSKSDKQSRRTPDGFTRIYINAGEEMGITKGDVIAAIMGETGLPAKVVGAIDIRDRHMFLDVAADQTHGIIAKLNRAKIKNHKVKVKVA